MQIESISLNEPLSLIENIHVKIREASQNTDRDMREFLGIGKDLQIMQDELLNNTPKLTEIYKRIQRDTKKLKELENDPTTYTNEQRQLYRDRLDNLNTETKGRVRDTLTELKRSSNTSCKDQTNP